MQAPASVSAPVPFQVAPEAPEEELHLRDLLNVLQRFKWTGVSVFLAVLVLTCSLTWVTPKQFEAVVQVAVSPSDPDIQVERPMALLAGRDTFFTTQIQLLKAWPIYAEVLKKLDLENSRIVPPFPPLEWLRGKIRELTGGEKKPPGIHERIRQFRNLVRVTPVRDSDVVKIAVRAGEPELARDLANTVAASFADATLRFKREKTGGDRHYLTERLTTTKADLIDAENELRRFEEEQDSISLDKRLEHLITLRIEGEGELSDVRRQVKEVEAQLGPLIQQLSKARKGVAKADTSAYASLQRQLLNLRLRRTQLLKTYTSQHPDVLSVSQEIALVEGKVRKAESALVRGNSGSVSAMDSVVANYNSRIQEQEALRARQASLVQLLEHYEKKLREQLALKSQYDFLNREVEANKKVYDLLLIRQKEAALKEDMQFPDARIIEPAVTPEKPVSPRVAVNLILGMLVGLVAGILAALFRSYMDRKVYDYRRLERDLQLGCVALIPVAKGATRGQGELNMDASIVDPITRMSLSAEFSNSEDPAAVVLVTSANPSEGKSTVSSHLALAFAQGGERTLLIDCDLRRPAASKIFDLPEGHLSVPVAMAGLPDIMPKNDWHENLTLIGSQKPTEKPLQVLSDREFAKLLMKLRRKYDRIILDSPPVNVVADPLVLAPLADRTVLVTRAERSQAADVDRAVRSLREVRARLAGFVLNGVDFRRDVYGYSYGYGYGYGYYEYREDKSTVA